MKIRNNGENNNSTTEKRQQQQKPSLNSTPTNQTKRANDVTAPWQRRQRNWVDNTTCIYWFRLNVNKVCFIKWSFSSCQSFMPYLIITVQEACDCTRQTQRADRKREEWEKVQIHRNWYKMTKRIHKCLKRKDGPNETTGWMDEWMDRL